MVDYCRQWLITAMVECGVCRQWLSAAPTAAELLVKWWLAIMLSAVCTLSWFCIAWVLFKCVVFCHNSLLWCGMFSAPLQKLHLGASHTCWPLYVMCHYLSPSVGTRFYPSLVIVIHRYPRFVSSLIAVWCCSSSLFIVICLYSLFSVISCRYLSSLITHCASSIIWYMHISWAKHRVWMYRYLWQALWPGLRPGRTTLQLQGVGFRMHGMA